MPTQDMTDADCIAMGCSHPTKSRACTWTSSSLVDYTWWCWGNTYDTIMAQYLSFSYLELNKLMHFWLKSFLSKIMLIFLLYRCDEMWSSIIEGNQGGPCVPEL